MIRFAPLFPKVEKTVEQKKEINRLRHERWYDAHIDELKEYYADRWRQGKTTKQRRERLKNGDVKENTSVSIIQMDINKPFLKSDDTFCSTFPKSGKNKKMTLLMRKNKKIVTDLAKLDAKAAAFREKLAEGLVVPIDEHLFL